MAKVKRIHIFQEDARRLEDRFWTLDIDRVDFKVVFHRVNEVLDRLLEADCDDVLEELTREWVVDEANRKHEVMS